MSSNGSGGYAGLGKRNHFLVLERGVQCGVELCFPTWWICYQDPTFFLHNIWYAWYAYLRKRVAIGHTYQEETPDIITTMLDR